MIVQQVHFITVMRGPLFGALLSAVVVVSGRGIQEAAQRGPGAIKMYMLEQSQDLKDHM